MPPQPQAQHHNHHAVDRRNVPDVVPATRVRTEPPSAPGSRAGEVVGLVEYLEHGVRWRVVYQELFADEAAALLRCNEYVRRIDWAGFLRWRRMLETGAELRRTKGGAA